MDRGADSDSGVSRWARLAACALGAALLGAGCQVEPLPSPDRWPAPRPLPAEIAALGRYERVDLEARLELKDEDEDGRHFGGVLVPRGRAGARAARAEPPLAQPTLAQAPPAQPPLAQATLAEPVPPPDRIRLEWFESRTPGPARRPVVAVVPIFGGSYGVSRLIARQIVKQGWHALIVYRARRILEHDEDPPELERLLAEAARNIRRTIDWAAARPEVDPDRVGLVGVSLGAMVGTITLAFEPRIRRAVLVMGGGDMPGIISESWEQPVHAYKVRRMDRLGLETDEAFRASMRLGFRLDPLDLAPAIDASRVLQLVTRYDNRVPTKYQLKLWEALGRPRGFLVPTGHYTLAVRAGFALDAMRAFFKEGFR